MRLQMSIKSLRPFHGERYNNLERTYIPMVGIYVYAPLYCYSRSSFGTELCFGDTIEVSKIQQMTRKARTARIRAIVTVDPPSTRHPTSTLCRTSDIEDLRRVVGSDDLMQRMKKANPGLIKKTKQILALPKGQDAEKRSPVIESAITRETKVRCF